MEIKNQAVRDFAVWVATNALPGRHQRGSANTIQGYITDLELFANWFKETTGLDLSATALTPDDIQDYISHAQTVEKKKPATVLRRFAAIRAYALYLQQTDERISSDLTTGIRLPKKDPASKRGLRRLERLAVGRVFTVPWKETEVSRQRLIRDKAIVFTLMYVGLRIEELVNLKMENVSISERSGFLTVVEGKGNKYRTVGVSSKARQALLEWLDLRKKLGVEHDYLFVQIRKGYDKLSKRAVQYTAEEVGVRAKLEIKLTPHILRHTAVRVWRQQTDDRTTAAQMGHSVATMQRYDAIKESDVLNVADNF